MEQIYCITGAKGHLGGTLVKLLGEAGVTLRCLILPQEQEENTSQITYYTGDVRDQESMRPFFAHEPEQSLIVIHCAGIIDISPQASQQMVDVNVGGTRNVLALCKEYAVQRLVYVSSVHAIPEGEPLAVMTEVKRFSPDWVTGGYAKTKAQATQLVLDAVAEGLNAVVVHPSGILGPHDNCSNHLVQMVEDYIRGKLPACVRGGYDFVDVRDVARGCLTAATKGRTGECYILSNRHYEVKEVLQITKSLFGGPSLPVLPMWMAKACAPLITLYSKLSKSRPLYTRYSLYTLQSNDRFSHDKATAELDYRPRDLRQTLAATIQALPSRVRGKTGARC